VSQRGVASGLAGLLLIVVLAACGSDDESGAPSGNVGSGVRLDAPINLADCTDWNEGTVDERFGSIEQIREFTGGPVGETGATGAVLSDERAYDLFEATCSNEYARGFKLYKVYGRGAAFGGES
jgi:hypothetical protein